MVVLAPEQINPGPWSQVSVGGSYYALAIKSDNGTLWSWGSNNGGTLGLGPAGAGTCTNSD